MTALAPERTKAPPTLHMVTQYAHDVTDGKVVAGRAVRLACQRHLDDLEHGAERGLSFDERAATSAIEFFHFLQLAEGEHDGKPFDLQPWQAFIVGSLFGWEGEDGYRRFRLAYIEAGKGSGKSPLLAGIGLYMLVADGEAAAECYAAAVTRDQAKISFTDAKRMVESSPALAKRVDVLVNNLSHGKSGSFFRPVSSEARALDGKRPHFAGIDEIHEHPNSMVVDKMRAGTKGRRQALIVEITNSGYDRKSVCFQHHTYSMQILEGALANDAWFAYVCQLDVCEECRAAGKVSPTDGCPDCDDWTDEACWLKANPNLGVSLTWKYLREQVAEAIGMPAKSGIVMRLNFCIWTQSVTKWLPIDRWQAGNAPVSREELQGRRCFGGLDLAPVRDLSCFALVFPPVEPGEKWKCLLRTWCCEDDILERSRRDRVPYDLWARQGYVEPTEGNTTDFAWIEKGIVEDSKYFSLQTVAYDRAFAHSLVLALKDQHGLQVADFGQGFFSMAAPTSELERMIRAGELQHGGNPVLDWMVSNVVVATDPAGNLKPDKEHSTERIDGIVALIMAIAMAMGSGPPKVSIYNTKRLVTIG